MVMASVGLLLMGCYELQPVGGVVPEIGAPAAFDINDAGRLALGGQMGPEIAQIEGNLLARDNDEYVVGVTMVHLLRGGEQVWRGEKVRLKTAYVTSTYVRKFSTVRTAGLAAATIAAVVAVARKSLNLTGTDPDAKAPKDTGQSVRIPLR